MYDSHLMLDHWFCEYWQRVGDTLRWPFSLKSTPYALPSCEPDAKTGFSKQELE